MRKVLHLLIDENVLIQCKDLKSLPWKELTEGTIEIIIPLGVLREIDKHKSEGNTRRARRARVANSIIGQIIDSDTKSYSICKEKVTIKISTAFNIESENKILNIGKVDDTIVNEALFLKNKQKLENIFVLGGDRGLQILCISCGVDFITIPADWLREPERDDRDKQIEELEREILLLKNSFPSIKITTETPKFDFIRKNFSPLTFEQITSIVDTAKRVIPKETEFDCKLKESKRKKITIGDMRLSGITGHWSFPSKEDIEEYNFKYDEWVQELEFFLGTIHDDFQKYYDRETIQLFIENNGAAPADNILLDLKIDIPLLLDPNEKHVEKSLLKLPNPPKTPKKEFKDFYNTPNFPRIMPRESLGIDICKLLQKRNSARFYLDSSNEPSTFLKYSCTELRHKFKKQVVQFDLLMATSLETGDSVSRGIKCRLSASNINEVYEHIIPISVTAQAEDTFEYALKLIKETFADLS